MQRLALCALLLVPACSSSTEPEPGLEPGDGPPLALEAGASPAPPAGSEAGPGLAPDGGATQPACGFSSAVASCQSCLQGSCGASCASCSGSAECVALFNCVKACPLTSTTCAAQCRSQHAGAQAAYDAFFGSAGCLKSKCQAACSSTTSADGGGATKPDAGAGSTLEQARQICVDTINKLRAQKGSSPLQRDKAKEACADAQAKADATHNQAHWAYFNGSPSCIVDNLIDRQNECPGWYGPPATGIVSCLQKQYAEAPSGQPLGNHHDVLTYAGYKSVACGFHVVSGNDVWMVQNYY